MSRKLAAVVLSVTFAISFVQAQSQNPSAADKELLNVRERVWRSWFAGDTKTLEQMVPSETVVMSGGEEKWKHQDDIIRGSAEFLAQGGKLLRLEFPRTEIQHFGNVAIIWSSYSLETEVGGKRSTASGRVTEIFVRRNGQWTNPGWHTESAKCVEQ